MEVSDTRLRRNRESAQAATGEFEEPPGDLPGRCGHRLDPIGEACRYVLSPLAPHAHLTYQVVASGSSGT